MDPSLNDICINRSLNFLTEFEWIHNFPLTHLFKDKILSKIPFEWTEVLRQLSTDELNQLPFIDKDIQIHEIPSQLPKSLTEFLAEASLLSIKRQQHQHATTNLGTEMGKGMNPKKKHEVEYLASLVNKVMEDSRCNIVVDIGSGLGYLDHALHVLYGHPVIGLEACQGHTTAAEARAVRQGIQCGRVINRKFNITNSPECTRDFRDLIEHERLSLLADCKHTLKKELQHTEVRVCVVGLHCCGDLSTSVLSLFDLTDCVKAVCCVSCCYHKMAYGGDKFTSFPWSNQGRAQVPTFSKGNNRCPLSPYTLRLGAQEGRCRWKEQTTEEHEDHTRHVAYRALMEMTDIPNCHIMTIRKRIRKCDFTNFDSFLESFFKEDGEKPYRTDAVNRTQSELRKLYQTYHHQFDLIEPLTCLQTVIQPVIESLVYYDRLVWLKEKGYAQSSIVTVFNDAISPRNLALVSIKHL